MPMAALPKRSSQRLLDAPSPSTVRGVYRDSTSWEMRKPCLPENTLNKVTYRWTAESRLPNLGDDDGDEDGDEDNDNNGNRYIRPLTFPTPFTVSSFVKRWDRMK